MPRLKDRVENNVVIWLLGSLLTGFLAGLGAYEGALNIMKLKTISGDRLRTLEATERLNCEDAPDAYSVPLPDYLGSAEIELLFNNVKEAYNNEDFEELYELIGPIGRAQISKDTASEQLRFLYQNFGAIENGFFVQHQFIGKFGLYRTFALNFSVEFEEIERGIAAITIIDDGSTYQVHGIILNRL